jgi:hypothetical protein
MGLFFVVIPAPILHFFLSVDKAQEPVGVETFFPEASVDASMKALSVGFPGREKRRADRPRRRDRPRQTR